MRSVGTDVGSVRAAGIGTRGVFDLNNTSSQARQQNGFSSPVNFAAAHVFPPSALSSTLPTAASPEPPGFRHRRMAATGARR